MLLSKGGSLLHQVRQEAFRDALPAIPDGNNRFCPAGYPAAHLDIAAAVQRLYRIINKI